VPLQRTRLPLFVPAPTRLEVLVDAELRALGIRGARVEGGIAWDGGWDDVIRANLHLRIGSRVLVRIASFRCRALGELERRARDIDWERWLPAGRALRLRVSAGRSRIYHERAAEERLRRALAARGLPDAPPAADDAAAPLAVVRIFRDEVTVSADTSGAHLHRRGYRLVPGTAPLRETLAAAALRAVGWTGALPLADPFAGSGTIAIEAALLALDVAPGIATRAREPRAFAFLDWPDAPREAFAAAVEDARRAVRPAAAAPILASDRDAGALAALRANAGAAGVLEHLRIEHAPFGDAPLPAGAAWLVTNPPYGERLGQRRALRPLYRALGRRVREAGPQLRAAFFEADPVLARETGLVLEPLFTTRNGGIRVRLVAARQVPEPIAPNAPARAHRH
jgi:putative N6-adenine-specific DNA methylase